MKSLSKTLIARKLSVVIVKTKNTILTIFCMELPMDPTDVSHQVNYNIPPLLYWEDPVHSAAFFVPVFTFLMSVQYNSLVLVCAYSSLAVLVLVAVCKIYVYMMVKILKKLTELKRLFFCENIIDTGKFTISLYCLTYIGSWFSLLTVVIIAWTGLFTLPKVYLNNQVSTTEEGD